MKRIRVGQVLIFNYEGSAIDLKIMRIKDGKVWAKRTHLYTEDEIREKFEMK